VRASGEAERNEIAVAHSSSFQGRRRGDKENAQGARRAGSIVRQCCKRRRPISSLGASARAGHASGDGKRVYPIELADTALEGIVDALVHYGQLSESETCNQRRIAEELGRQLAWWAKKLAPDPVVGGEVDYIAAGIVFE